MKHTVRRNNRRLHRSVSLVLAATIGTFAAPAPIAADEQASRFDKIWAVPELYDNPDNSVIQSFALVGRYHGQYWAVKADQGDADAWENRRMIAGFNSTWWNNFTFEAQMYIATDEDSYYDGLYVAFVEWSPDNIDFALSVGRLDYLFTGLERSTSSKKINTIERGLLVNQLMPAEVVGVHAEGNHGKLFYHGGVFSGNLEDEFSDFNSGSAAVIGFGYATDFVYEQGHIQLDYLYNNSSDDGNAFRRYDNVVSLWHRGSTGRFGMGVDLTTAQSMDSSGSVWGLTLEPSWMLLDALFAGDDPLQAVLRYQYASSSEDNGLVLQRRYEQRVTEGDGNTYQALYAGLNYYLYDQKLKLMVGGEYASMKDDADDGGDYLGWTWFGALRLYF
jgi:hypothetical protein